MRWAVVVAMRFHQPGCVIEISTISSFTTSLDLCRSLWSIERSPRSGSMLILDRLLGLLRVKVENVKP